MDYSLIHKTSGSVICLLLLTGILLLFFLGQYVRSKWNYENTETKGGIASLHSALYGLFAFILAITFSLSGQRYDYTQSIFIEESNAISAALRRCDLYPDSVRILMHRNFREYLDARIEMYQNLKDTAAMRASADIIKIAGERLWDLVTRQSKLPDMWLPSGQMIPALNQMFELQNKRELLLRRSIPDLIVIMVLVFALSSSFLAGVTAININNRDRLIILFFALFSTIVIFITLDLGRPLRGIIKADIAEQSITDIRNQLNED